MIKTKIPVIVDAQNGTEATVFFRVNRDTTDRENNLVVFNLVLSYITTNEKGENVLTDFRENKAYFKRSTFKALFGEKTFNQFEDEIDQLIIDQIAYINTYEWIGNEAQAKVKYWNLKAEDLEIVNPV
jgi:hypothetical protein